jgi:hypothetical protein
MVALAALPALLPACPDCPTGRAARRLALGGGVGLPLAGIVAPFLPIAVVAVAMARARARLEPQP